MATIKILIDGREFDVDEDGIAELGKLRVKRDYHGAEISSAYGDVAVELELNGQPKTFTLRVGAREWQAAEEAFKPLKGVPAITRHFNSSETALIQFYKIALSRHHAALKLTEIQDLIDYRPTDGRATLQDALERALAFSKPAIFSDEVIDPKAKAAVMAAFLGIEAVGPATPTSELPATTPA